MHKKSRKALLDTVRCPYMPQHVMHLSSLPTHLIRCKATNKGQFKICPYNSIHVISKYEIDSHVKECEDRYFGSSYIASPQEMTQMMNNYYCGNYGNQALTSEEAYWEYPTQQQDYIIYENCSKKSGYSSTEDPSSHYYDNDSSSSNYVYGYYEYQNESRSCKGEVPQWYEQYYEDYANYPQRIKVQQMQKTKINKQYNLNKKFQVQKIYEIPGKQQSNQQQKHQQYQNQHQHLQIKQKTYNSSSQYYKSQFETQSKPKPKPTYKNKLQLCQQSQHPHLAPHPKKQPINKKKQKKKDIGEENKLQMKNYINKLNESVIQDQVILQFVNQIDNNLKKIQLQNQQYQDRDSLDSQLSENRRPIKDFRHYQHMCRSYSRHGVK